MFRDALRRLAVSACRLVGIPALVAIAHTHASAQDHRDGRFVDLKAGACAIRVELPPEVSLGQPQLVIDEAPTVAEPRLVSSHSALHQVIEFRLRQPLWPNSSVRVDYGPGSKTTIADVVPSAGSLKTSCASGDDRGSFEPSLFYGVVSDAFSPNSSPDQIYAPGTAYPIKVEQIGRLDAQVRLGGGSGNIMDHAWLHVEATYGVRSSDLDCDGADKSSPACDPTSSAFAVPKDAGQAFTAVVLRASRIEAVFEPRVELHTFFRTSGFPMTPFISARLGFSQQPNDVKPPNLFQGGAGFVVPGGAFRDSGFCVTAGQDHGYRTNPHGLRVRMDFRFQFGAAPSFRDEVPFVSRLSQGVRGLIQVVIDRNPFGPGPDGAQTFLGVVLDIRRLLGT